MALLERVRAAVDAWQNYGKAAPPTPHADRYSVLWSWYAGTWTLPGMTADMWRANANRDPLYDGTKQSLRSASAIADFYEQLVYKGPLSTNGEPLPDGTRGAIPIDPQTGKKNTDAQLVRAFSEFFSMTNYQQEKSVRPKLCSILGDCLTEIVDDYPHGKVYSQTYWPGAVPDCDLEIDAMGHVKRYALEYPITILASTAFGRTVEADGYMFRKEVDGEAFRFYKDGVPFDYPDIGPAVQKNPYGFAPAVWDRHSKVPWSNRGMSAIERTLAQEFELNSLFSHAVDYQRKKFSAPIGVKGSPIANRGGRVVQLPGGVSVTFPTDEGTQLAAVEAQRRAAEQMDLIRMDEHGEFVTIDFDVGQTMAMLTMQLDSILAEAPEARFAQELRQMSQVTGPAMDRILEPILGRVASAQDMHDPCTLQILQTGTAMMGFRYKNGDIPRAIVAARPSRFAAFEPFDLTSFPRGLLDAAIVHGAIFEETPLEKAQRMLYVQQVTDPDLMLELGRSEEVVNQLTADRQAQADMQAQMLTGLATAQAQNSPPQPTGPSGPSGATGVA